MRGMRIRNCGAQDIPRQVGKYEHHNEKSEREAYLSEGSIAILHLIA